MTLSPAPSTKESKGHIHSIESCGTVDGPGIRYVIFFQGCPMRCRYCHNPDTWNPEAGELMTVEQVLSGFYSNLPFYRNGGVTITGGEPMMQMDFLIALLGDLKQHQVHTCIDTAGVLFAPDSPSFRKKLDRMLPLTDLILLDIKHMDDMEHRTLTGHSNAQILDFARYLDAHDIPVWVRHVAVPGITLHTRQLESLGRFLATLHNVRAVEVLPYHSMGIAKYDALGIDYPLRATPEPSKEEIRTAEETILSAYKSARTPVK